MKAEKQALLVNEAPVVEVWQDSQKSSGVHAFFTISKCFVGAASLELPHAILDAGWLAGLLLILAIALISYYTLITLARCGHLVSERTRDAAPTYPSLGRAAFGAPGSAVAYFGVLAMTVGVVGDSQFFSFTSQ